MYKQEVGEVATMSLSIDSVEQGIILDPWLQSKLGSQKICVMDFCIIAIC